MARTLWPDIKRCLTTAAPPARRPGTLANTVTTVDIKLTYDATQDRLVPVIVDVNATPAAIAEAHDRLADQDVIAPAAAAFTSNLQGTDAELLLFHSERAYSDEASTWNEDRRIGRNRAVLAEAIAAKPAVHAVTHTADPDRLTVDAGKIHIGAERVDGYVNFHEDGDVLLNVFEEDITALSRGANAPTGCWVTSIDITGKWGLMNCASRLLKSLDTTQVRVPKFTRAGTVSAITQFQEELGQLVIIKSPYGSWGREVVPFAPDDNIYSRLRELAASLPEGFRGEGIVDQRTGSLSVHSSRERSEYVLVEEAIVPTDSPRDVLVIPPGAHPASKTSPIDLTVLACRSDPSDERAVETPSKLLRLSGDPNWNLHAGEVDDTIISVERAYDGPVTIERSAGEAFEIDIAHLLEETAGRSITKSELQRAMQTAGECALGIRNLAAFAAESRLDSESSKNTS